MKFGYVTWIDDVSQAGRVASAAESSGFDLFAVGDTFTMFRDPFVLLGLAAAATRAIRVGCIVTNPSTRHPAAIANAIATVDEAGPGRAFVGLGTGDNAVRNVGMRAATLQEMEEAIRAIRGLVAGEAVVVRDHVVVNRWSRRRVPIMMAAEGPRSLRLAGRMADGVIIGTGLTPESISRSRAVVAEGAESAGRSLDDLELWYLARWAINSDRDAALGQIASLMASVGHHALKGDTAAKGVPADMIPAIKELERRYDSSHHSEPGWSPNALLAKELGLLDFLAERFAIVGSGPECADRVRALTEPGVQNLLLTAANTRDPIREVAQWSSEVISRLPR